jgi:hypothetical protein
MMATPDEQVAELRAEIKALRDRIDAIEAFPAELLKAIKEQLAEPLSMQAPQPGASGTSRGDVTAGGVEGDARLAQTPEAAS